MANSPNNYCSECGVHLLGEFVLKPVDDQIDNPHNMRKVCNTCNKQVKNKEPDKCNCCCSSNDCCNKDP